MIPGIPITLLGVAVLGAAAAPPRSESIPIRVELDAPPGCSDADAFYLAVLSRVDRARRASPGETGVRLQVRLSRVRNRVEGELRVLDGRGGGDRRTVAGATCDEVVEGLSLTAALALESAGPEPPPSRAPPRPVAPSAGRPAASVPSDSSPASSTRAPSPDRPAPPTPPAPAPSTSEPAVPTSAPTSAPTPPESAAPPPPAAVPPPPPAEPPVVARPARLEAQGRFGLAVGVNALAAALVSPYFSTGGALSLRLVTREPSPASLALSVLYLPNRLLLPDEELVLDFAGAALTVCPGWGIGATITVEPCARAIGGWLEATNDAVTNPRSAGRSFWGVGALARAALRLGAGFSLEMELGFAVPLVERRFVTTTPERLVGETPTVSGMVGLGLVRGL